MKDLNKLFAGTFFAEFFKDFDGKIIDVDKMMNDDEEILEEMTEIEKIIYSIVINQTNIYNQDPENNQLLGEKIELLGKLMWTMISDRIQPTENLAIRSGFNIVKSSECHCQICMGSADPFFGGFGMEIIMLGGNC